jgi:hypothetical protein
LRDAPIARGQTCRARFGLVFGLCAALACSPGPDPSPEAFCDTLTALGEGRIEVGSGQYNEMVGHVASLEALMAVAPDEIHEDLELVRDRLTLARDAGGWSTLIDFAALQRPDIADAEGRVTRFAAEQCGVQYGPVGWSLDEVDPGEPQCPGWPRMGSPLVHNRFPYLLATAAANYFSTVFWAVPFVPAPPGFISVERGGWVEFEGQYPYTRYFAYHPNDYETNNFDPLTDHRLDPDPGSVNPWREDAEGQPRRYTARLVFDEAPETPEPNTRYVGRTESGRFNPVVFLLLRIYAADQGALPPNSAGVPLPKISVYDADGSVRRVFEECDPYPPGYEPPVDETVYPRFPVPDHRAVFSPGELNTKDNWGMPVTLLGNRDNLYIVAPYSRARGEVFVARAKKPRTPSRKLGIPLWSKDVDMRLWTVCTYNFWNGTALTCRVDEDIPADASGHYTLVVSDAANRPANSGAADGVSWFDSGPFLDGQLTYRILLADQPLVQQMKRVIGGEALPEAAAYVPKTAFCSRADFEGGGWRGCFEAAGESIE